MSDSIFFVIVLVLLMSVPGGLQGGGINFDAKVRRNSSFQIDVLAVFYDFNKFSTPIKAIF